MHEPLKFGKGGRNSVPGGYGLAVFGPVVSGPKDLENGPAATNYAWPEAHRRPHISFRREDHHDCICTHQRLRGDAARL